MAAAIAAGRVVFAGCARNCQAHLPAVLDNLERLAGLFREAAYVIVENDSTDRTKEILFSWGASRRQFELIKLDGLAATPQRTLRLEIARNACREAIRRRLHEADFVLVMDFDDSNREKIDLDGVLSAVKFLEQDSSHAAVFANTPGPYYDMWALRHSELCPDDIWEGVLDYRFTHDVTDQDAFDAVFAKRIFSIPRHASPVEVDSAFGGLGIYRMEYFSRGSNPYLGSKMKLLPWERKIKFVRWQCCEHVHFHQGIRSIGGRLFVLPQLVTGAAVVGLKPVPSFFRSCLF